MRISFALPAILLIGTGHAQQPAPDSNVVIKSSTQEVLLEVVVRDAHGKLVTKVDPSQVTVFENGVRQEIRSFRLVEGTEVRAEDEKQMAQAQAAQAASGKSVARPALNPLRTVNVVCLVLNDLTPDTRSFAFDAARKFVNNELRPDTFIGVFSLDTTGLRPVFPFSNNREHLLKAVQLAAINQLPALTLSTASILNGLSLTTIGASTVGTEISTPSAPNGISLGPSGSQDGTVAAAMDPLGTWGDIGVATVAGLREIDALEKLVRQLSSLPFQKTVLLLSTGLTRPPDQLERWRSLISSANQSGVTFYGLDVYGLGVCQDSSTSDCAMATTPSSASVGLLRKAAGLSQTQSTVGVLAPGQGGSSTPNGGPGGALMDAGRQSDYLKFGVQSANTQEALRELAESTGGFLIANTNNTDKLLARVMEDVDTHYEISYRPATEIEDGHFRKIEVKLAGKSLRVETRSGYFAVPDTGERPLTPEEMAGLRALDTNPLPHSFDFQSKAFRFRSGAGTSEYAIAFQVPIASLTATPEEAAKKHKFHASVFALVKTSQGEVVDRVSKDVPSEVSDEYLPALRAESMTYEHAVNLAPGHYTVETAVVDHEANRSSTNILQVDNQEQPGLALSDIVLVHRVQDLNRPPDPSDPFEIPGKRATPFVSTALAAGADPSIYFVVYPDKNNHEMPGLRAQFLKDGRVLATQKSVLPRPDASGAIPMAIRAMADPGDYEVRITIAQGRESIIRSLKYTVAAQ